MSTTAHAGPAARLLLAALTTLPAAGQYGAADGEWTTYGGDLGSTRYSGLAQIDADNFGTLEVAWRFKTDNLGPRRETNLQSTPLMVNGVLYTTAGTRRSVIALDPATGELLWKFSLREGARGDFPVGVWPTGPTAARNASSTSPPATR